MSHSKKIMVIRHAEKPDNSGSPYGVTVKGEKDSESLIIQGWQRSGALACFFAPTHGALQNPGLATPEFLFASGVGKHSESKRPKETITPLSSKLNLKINTGFLKEKLEDMVKAAIACDGIVLIAWQHQDIPAIANQILGNENAPQVWPEGRFDLVWVFDWNHSSKSYSFSQIPQCLLAGDLPTVISLDD
jgi:hypothetical protein